jgi:hypothetical protein
VGYLMGVTIERAQGRAALVEVICDPARLVRRYNAAAQASGLPLPLWSVRLLDGVDGEPGGGM